jgi:hypothetical protein
MSSLKEENNSSSTEIEIPSWVTRKIQVTLILSLAPFELYRLTWKEASAWTNPDMYHGFISLNIKCEPVEELRPDPTGWIAQATAPAVVQPVGSDRSRQAAGAIYRGHDRMALPIERKGASIIGHGHRTIKGSKVLYNTKVPGLNR